MRGSACRIAYAAVVAVTLLVTTGCSSPSDARGPADAGARTVTVTVGATSVGEPTSSAPVVTATATRQVTNSPTRPVQPTASATPTRPPPTSPKAPPAQALRYTNWQSPSGNIACLADPTDAGSTVMCQVGEKTWSRPADAPECDGAGAGDNAVVLGLSGPARWLCAGDYWGGPSVPVLQYGQVTQVGDIECQSLRTGMHCYNLAAKHGFLLSRSEHEMF